MMESQSKLGDVSWNNQSIKLFDSRLSHTVLLD